MTAHAFRRRSTRRRQGPPAKSFAFWPKFIPARRPAGSDCGDRGAGSSLAAHHVHEFCGRAHPAAANSRLCASDLSCFSCRRSISALLPRRVKRAAAYRLATEQFVVRGIARKKDRSGILIFVSLAERYARIIADEGVAGAYIAGRMAGGDRRARLAYASGSDRRRLHCRDRRLRRCAGSAFPVCAGGAGRIARPDLRDLGAADH